MAQRGLKRDKKLERAKARDELRAQAAAVRKSLEIPATLKDARREGYPDAVPGSRAEGRGQSHRGRAAWYGQEPNPYAGHDGEPDTLGIGPARRRRTVLKDCRGGLLPVLVETIRRPS